MKPEPTFTRSSPSATIRPGFGPGPGHGRLFLSLVVPLSVFLAGCASDNEGAIDDDAGIDSLDGAGADRWHLPTDVWAGFERLFPDAKLLNWKRIVTDYDRVAYYVLFEDMSGVMKDAWLTPDGQLTTAPPPK